ncbi:MAG: tRNA preQ1(34) S-adenosylmethionine ribosyltransferase-isomerase QueA [Actinomycetota bacterium]
MADHRADPPAEAQPEGETGDHGALDYFDYDLPPERIAQEPVEPRHAARLLVDRIDGRRHRTVADLPGELAPGDVVVVNDTRVSAARLQLTKPTGGRVEVLLLRPTGLHRQWQALVRGGRRIASGTRLGLDGEELVEVGEQLGDGRRLVEVLADDVMDRVGEIPLPPYIHRPLADTDRYQTVFARNPGSVAAPTAGLHLSTELLDRMAAAGIEVVRVELQVGIGTFKPITADRIDDHHMHAETYHLDPEAWARIRSAERVIAVGTTVVRTLESAARTGELSGSTELFINRGFDWQVVDVLLTNFHVPKSSLLVLVDAFVGPRWRSIYDDALADGYRFLSLGDAMLLDRRHPEAW